MIGDWLRSKLQTRFGRVLIPFLAGAVAATGQAPLNWGMPTLLGLMGMFWLFTQANTPKNAFRSGWLAGAGYFAVALNWIVEPFLVDFASTGWMAPFALVFMAAGLALFWGTAQWLVHRLGRGVILWATALALAELVRAYIFTGFPWAMPAYAWVNSLAVWPSVWVGSHGLNFALFLLAGWLVSLMTHKGICSYKWPLFAALALSLIPVPKVQAPDFGPTFRLIQPNAPQDEKWRQDRMEVFFERQLALSTEPGAPDFIIWPETAVAVPIPYSDELLQEMAAIAGDAQIITGIQRIDGALNYNSLIVLDTSGNVEQIYDKHHLVPFGEYLPLGDLLGRFGLRGLAAEDGAGYASGTGPQTIALAGVGGVLPLICYEVVFPQDLRSADRPSLLLQITNDAWFGEFSGPYQHLAQARMRAVEQGLPMIRVANTGVSAVIDARGRVIASIPLGVHGYLDARQPKALPSTLYAKTGDWPVTFILLLSAALATLGARRIPIDGAGRQK